ncbi:MAG: tetratricopeptide repeat protein [Ignavibacteriales bacterium]|nr:tetratricopeptide repeat protein [Ignavibacteriales bacterium]
MPKKIFVIIFVLSSFLYSQTNDNEYTSALNHYQNKNYPAAYGLFKKISNNPSSELLEKSQSDYFGADCLLKMNMLGGAASEFENFIDKYKFSNFRETALYTLGSIYFNNGEFRKTREIFNYLLIDYPRSELKGSAYYWMAESYKAENKFVEAEEFFNNAVSNRQTNQYITNSIFSLAQLYESNSDYNNAVTNYDELLTYYKKDALAPKAQLRIGICYFNLKEYDSAVLELTDPLINELNANDLTEAKYYLANSFTRLKDFNNASAIYEELLQGDASAEFKSKINYSLAWIKFQTSDYNEAYNLFNELSKIESDTLAVSALYWSAECKRYSGDINEADEIYKTFLEKYPHHHLAARAQLGKGTVYYNKEQSDEAEKSLLNAVISNDPLTKGRAFTLLGEMKLSKKDFPEAKNYFSQALRFTENSAELNNRASLGLGAAEFYLNNYDDAVQRLENLQSRAKEFEKDKVNFYLAETYFARGEFSASLKHYNQINSADELLKKQTLLGKAYSHFNLKDFPNAVYNFNEYVNKYKKDKYVIDAKLRLADSYFGIKNFDKASTIYTEIFSKDRAKMNDDQIYYQYCQSLFKAGKSGEAISEFENLQRKFPRSKYADASQYIIGWINFQHSDFGGAIGNYKKLINKYPNSPLVPIAYYSIGDSYFNLGNYDSSIVFYNKILENFSNTSYVLDAANGIQYAYIAKDQPDNAVTFIDQFVSENPSSKYGDQIFFKKGDIFYSTDNYEKAIESYREFIMRYPSSVIVPNAYFWIGKSAANLKRETEALENFNKVVERSRKSDIGISAAIELSNLYAGKNQFNSSIDILNSAIDAQPASNRVPELLFLRGQAEVKANKSSEAAGSFDQIIKYYEGTVFAAKSKLELGILEYNNKNFDNSLILLNELAEKRTDDIGAQAQYFIGMIYFDQNKIDEAITAFVRVRTVYASFDEWYTKSLLRLGDSYVKAKDTKQARDMYKAVVNRHKTGIYAQEAKRKLNQL